MRIIGISEAPWSGGRELARAVAEAADFRLLDRHALQAVMAERGLPFPAVFGAGQDHDTSAGSVDVLAEPQEAAGEPLSPGGWLDLVHRVVTDLAAEEELVLVDCGAEFLFPDQPGVLLVRVEASWESRLARLRAAEGLADQVSAARRLVEEDARQTRLNRLLSGEVEPPPGRYDLVLRTDRLDLRTAAEAVLRAAEALEEASLSARDNGAGARPVRPRAEEPAPGQRAETGNGGPVFAHPSETEFARVLDFYAIEWLYEPRTFPIRWDSEGNVVEAFTPDFYLPEFDLYIELTTLKQNLVTRKNRKLRLLRQLYPELNIKVFYGRDFRGLLLKYGLGEGQAGPGRREKPRPE